MQRNGELVRKKYMEYLGSTLAFSLSIYLAAIVDGILVGQLLGPYGGRLPRRAQAR